eukprot:TRINITY_DN14976_c0_g1_i1.p1 TRINITY_DN14976_c0_g1~~TRINITY_DN14976_c0_g1_i1.p1  ORF type:complete len:373 (-),score=102.12 TRINITY_DN14976_c0_g1_i1:157-1275(-)
MEAPSVPGLQLQQQQQQHQDGLSPAQSARGAGPRRGSAALEDSALQILSARGSDPNSNRRPFSKKEFEARRKAMETQLKQEKLEELRKEDERRIKERALKATQERERAFEAQFEAVSKGDRARIEAAASIRQHEREQQAKRAALYKKWDDQVYQRVEFQLAKYMSDLPPEPPEEGWRDALLAKDCPSKRPQTEQKREDAFHREAQAIINAPPMKDASDYQRLKKYVSDREYYAELFKNREPTRPILPVPLWAQQHHYASPNGYFQQSCERQQQGLGFKSCRRMGTDAHLPDERDGVEYAGKMKTRQQKKCLGMLTGIVAKEGEAAQYKRQEGASCGAPMQDHYAYERTEEAVAREFPVGKRLFRELRELRGG